METVNYTSRIAGFDMNVFECFGFEARAYLSADALQLKRSGYTVEEGKGWLTATHPETGVSVTNTILKK